MISKWEYKFVDSDSRGFREDGMINTPDGITSNNMVRMIDHANEMGEDGWELLAVAAAGNEVGYHYCFKRQVQPE